MSGMMDLLQKISDGVVRFTDNVATPNVVADPNMAEMAGPEAEKAARAAALQRGRAALMNAGAGSGPWYQGLAERDMQGQNEYSNFLAHAAESANVLKARRDADERKANIVKLMEAGAGMHNEDGTPVFTESQQNALKLLPPEDAAKILQDQMFPAPPAARDKTMPIQVSDGYLKWDPKENDWIFHKTAADKVGGASGVDPTLANDPGVRMMAYQLLQGIKPTTRSAAVLRAVNAVAYEIGAAQGLDYAQIASRIGGAQLDFKSFQRVNDQFITTGASLAALHKHMATALEAAEKIGGRVNKPVIERWRQWIAGNYEGDADVTAFNVAYTEMKNEYMKIVGGGVNSVAGIDVASRQEGDRVFPQGITLGQLRAAKETADRVATEKLQSYADQMKRFTQSQLSWGQPGGNVAPDYTQIDTPPPAPSGPAPATPPPAPAGGGSMFPRRAKRARGGG